MLLPKGSIKYLPALYTDIISNILSFVSISDDPEDLLTFALVSREWYQLCRRFSFAKLDDLSPQSLPALRELLELDSPPNESAPTTAIAFAQYVRRAILYADLEPGEWSDTREITMLMDRSFTTRFKLTVMFGSGVLKSSHLLELKLSCSNITHLGLIGVQICMSKEKLSRILCDESSPSLTDLSLEKTVWGNDAEREEGDASSTHVSGLELLPDKRTFTLDHLHFLEEQCDSRNERFWPHDSGFEELVVKSLILRVDVLSDSFWDKAPDMLKKIASNLVELDAAHEMNYDRKLSRSREKSLLLTFCFMGCRFHYSRQGHQVPEAAHA